MKLLLAIVLFFQISISFSQNVNDKYLHYITNYYWDSTLYKTENSFFIENRKGELIKRKYPVLINSYFTTIDKNTKRLKPNYYRESYSEAPYKYKKKQNAIYIEFFDSSQNKIRDNKEYSLISNDTVHFLVNKNSIGSMGGISVSGYSLFLGRQSLKIKGKIYEVYKFYERHDNSSSHSSLKEVEVYLDSTTLTPVKFISQYDKYKSDLKSLYRYETILNLSSQKLISYSNKKQEDLITYQNKTVIWTEKQKEYFINQFGENESGKKYLECLLTLLNGQIPFYEYESNLIFKSLTINSKCNQLIEKDK